MSQDDAATKEAWKEERPLGTKEHPTLSSLEMAEEAPPVPDPSSSLPSRTKSAGDSAATLDRRQTLLRQDATVATYFGPKVVVPTPQTELAKVTERHGPDSWQVKALLFINDPRFQHALMALLILDVCILMVEMFLDAWYPSCHVITRDAVSCCPPSDATSGADAEEEAHVRFLLGTMTEQLRRLAEGGGGQEDDGAHGHSSLADGEHHSVCEAPLVETEHAAGCDDHKYDGVHTAHTVLFSLTIVILSVFEIELFVLLVTLGARLFFSHLLYVLDLFVVTVSLVLELTFRFALNNDLLAELAGLLVILRVWRFVRIGHGLVVTTMEIEAERREKIEERMAKLERILLENGLELPSEDSDDEDDDDDGNNKKE